MEQTPNSQTSNVLSEVEQNCPPQDGPSIMDSETPDLEFGKFSFLHPEPNDPWRCRVSSRPPTRPVSPTDNRTDADFMEEINRNLGSLLEITTHEASVPPPHNSSPVVVVRDVNPYLSEENVAGALISFGRVQTCELAWTVTAVIKMDNPEQAQGAREFLGLDAEGGRIPTNGRSNPGDLINSGLFAQSGGRKLEEFNYHANPHRGSEPFKPIFYKSQDNMPSEAPSAKRHCGETLPGRSYFERKSPNLRFSNRTAGNKPRVRKALDDRSSQKRPRAKRNCASQPGTTTTTTTTIATGFVGFGVVPAGSGGPSSAAADDFKLYHGQHTNNNNNNNNNQDVARPDDPQA